MSIELKFAQDAFRGTSFHSEERGARFIRDVDEHLAQIAQWVGQWRTDDNAAAIDEALAYYRQKYTELARAYLAAHSRCISSFIAGPSGFPVERARKANASADKRLNDWLEWAHRQRERLARQFNPNAPQVISADDGEAVAKLRAKLEKLRNDQEMYKTANKICRRKITDDEVAAALADLGLNDEAIHAALHPMWGSRGFEAYVLSNNNANIKRVEQRIAALEAEQARREVTPSEYEINGVRVEEDAGDNRLKLWFAGKPAASVIAALKAHGFHWSPRQGCWMRQLNEHARRAAREVLGE